MMKSTTATRRDDRRLLDRERMFVSVEAKMIPNPLGPHLPWVPWQSNGYTAAGVKIPGVTCVVDREETPRRRHERRRLGLSKRQFRKHLHRLRMAA